MVKLYEFTVRILLICKNRKAKEKEIYTMFTLIQLLKLIVMSGDMDQCVTIVGHELLFFAFVDNELYFSTKTNMSAKELD